VHLEVKVTQTNICPLKISVEIKSDGKSTKLEIKIFPHFKEEYLALKVE